MLQYEGKSSKRSNYIIFRRFEFSLGWNMHVISPFTLSLVLGTGTGMGRQSSLLLANTAISETRVEQRLPASSTPALAL